MVEVETKGINQTKVQSEQGLTLFQGNGIIWLQLVNVETYGKSFYRKKLTRCPIVYLYVNPWGGTTRCINNNSHFKYDRVLIRKAGILCCSRATTGRLCWCGITLVTKDTETHYWQCKIDIAFGIYRFKKSAYFSFFKNNVRNWVSVSQSNPPVHPQYLKPALYLGIYIGLQEISALPQACHKPSIGNIIKNNDLIPSSEESQPLLLRYKKGKCISLSRP